MLTTATAAVQEGKSTPQDAAAFITQFYTKGLLQRQIDNNLSGMNFAPVEKYKARVENAGTFGASSLIDLTNYSQVLHQLNRNTMQLPGLFNDASFGGVR